MINSEKVELFSVWYLLSLLWKRRGLRGSSKAGQEELVFRHVLWAIPSVAAHGETSGYGLEMKSTTGESCRAEGDRKRSNKHETVSQMHDGLDTLLFLTGKMEDKCTEQWRSVGAGWVKA